VRLCSDKGYIFLSYIIATRYTWILQSGYHLQAQKFLFQISLGFFFATLRHLQAAIALFLLLAYDASTSIRPSAIAPGYCGIRTSTTCFVYLEKSI
jgi:hypothetical protein